MPHILKNKNLEINIDLPLEGYQLSRFDWTGKITTVKYKNKSVSGFERTDAGNGIDFGKGFYNEFGITQPIGYDEAKADGWFHKIGVGLLKRDQEPYNFFKKYVIDPAEFEINHDSTSFQIICTSKNCDDYSYVLIKLVELTDSGFKIKYNLKNTGSKLIRTDEYVHNFICLDQDNIGDNYQLTFPFQLKSQHFNEFVNKENSLEIKDRYINFNSSPEDQFFISNLSGSKFIKGEWELVNNCKKLGIKEIVDFKTNKINLWGWKHVISPEIFFRIKLKPNDSVSWTRKYGICDIP